MQSLMGSKQNGLRQQGIRDDAEDIPRRIMKNLAAFKFKKDWIKRVDDSAKDQNWSWLCCVKWNESELIILHMNESEVVHSVFNSRESDVDDNLVNDRFKTVRKGPPLVTAGNQTNGNAGIKDNVDAVPTQQYILLPLFSDSPQSSEDAVANDAGKKTTKELANEGERNGQ
ncbi:hypothetical protein Tco_0218623 [Tanacetum coccineum]